MENGRVRRKAGHEWLSLVKSAEPVGREGGQVGEQGREREEREREEAGRPERREGGRGKRERKLVYPEAVWG